MSWRATSSRPSPDPTGVRASVNRTSRIRAIAATALAAAAAIVVIIAGSALTHSSHRADPPVDRPSPPTPTEHLEIPAGQQTITPDIGPGDITGLDVLATVTNTQPEHRNDTSLTATVTVHTGLTVSRYCRSHDVPTWIAYADFNSPGDLLPDPDQPGAGYDAWGFSKCLPDDATSFEPPDLGWASAQVPESRTIRMVAIAPPSAELRACLADETGQEYCPLPEPIAATDAEFGFRAYEEKPAPWVLEILEGQGNSEPLQFKALESIDGVGWLVDRAVVAAPDSDRLAFELPTSGAGYVIDVYVADGPHRDRCTAQHADELPDYASTDSHVYETAVEKVCGGDLRLVVDGSTVKPDDFPDQSNTGHFSELGAQLSPAADHQVEVELVRGDPRNIRYAVVVRTRTQIP